MRYTAGGLEGIWVASGGAPQNELWAAAVATAESGGTSTAVSSSGDYGLWQIHLAVHVGDGGISYSNWMTPVYNAYAAITISGNGTNWGPWCTAWDNPATCGRGVLSVPQTTSPAAKAYNQIVTTGAAAIPGTTTTTVVQQEAPTPTAEWTNWRGWIKGYYPPMVDRLASLAQAFDRF